MKTQIIAGLLTAALAIPAAYAADPSLVATANVSTAVSRAQVKQEARTAELTNQIPRGQQAWPDASLYAPSTLARADVKAQTRIAEAHGLIPRGQQEFGNTVLVFNNDVSRAEVKADTRAAVAHHLIPRGESNVNY